MTERRAPPLIDAMIAIDVGPGAGAREDESAVVWAGLVVTYQLTNVAAWFVGKVPLVGPLVANTMVRSLSLLGMGGLMGAWTPTPWFEQSYTQSYPYWHVSALQSHMTLY